MPVRAFKTAWFSKAARKARIGDDELCEAVRAMMTGQADDLGGGVFKKRLNRNMHRSIVLMKFGSCWMYQYLFAKKDRANIDADELKAFRLLARSLASTTEADLVRLVSDGAFLKICEGELT